MLYVRGPKLNSFFKFESGVHRVQRVPATEASGRIHTSTVTVAVLPEVEDVEVEIQSQGYPHRYLRRFRPGRPAREQDRIGHPHHPFPHRHRGHLPG